MSRARVAIELDAPAVLPGERLTGRVRVVEGGRSRGARIWLRYREVVHFPEFHGFKVKDLISTLLAYAGPELPQDLEPGAVIGFDLWLPAEAPITYRVAPNEIGWELFVAEDPEAEGHDVLGFAWVQVGAAPGPPAPGVEPGPSASPDGVLRVPGADAIMKAVSQAAPRTSETWTGTLAELCAAPDVTMDMKGMRAAALRDALPMMGAEMGMSLSKMAGRKRSAGFFSRKMNADSAAYSEKAGERVAERLGAMPPIQQGIAVVHAVRPAAGPIEGWLALDAAGAPSMEGIETWDIDIGDPRDPAFAMTTRQMVSTQMAAFIVPGAQVTVMKDQMHAGSLVVMGPAPG